MGKMLHNEARELLVESYEKTHNDEEIAKIFGVNKYTVYHMAERKRKTGSVALRTSQRGRKQLLNDEDKQHIRQCIDETPDITLAELRTKLGLKASIQTLSRVVRAMGYRVKKKSMSASEQERPRCAERTYRLARIRLGKTAESPCVSGRKQRQH